MHDQTEPKGDAIERFLETQFPVVAAEDSRQALLHRTLGILHRRQRFKRVGLIAALAACYAAGLGTMRLWMTPPAQPAVPIIVEVTPEAPQASHVAVVPPAVSAPAQDTDLEAPPLILERIAAVSEGRRARLYRIAGDRYLEDNGDTQGALRCYTLALKDAREEELSITADDSWLLMALKKARLEEKNHDKNGG